MNKEEVRRQAESARRMPSSEAAYRNLVLNQRCNAVNPFVSESAWEACAGPIDPGLFESADCFGGLDLSARNDLTAKILVAKDKDDCWHVKCHFFAPSIGIVERSQRDRVPYDLWANQGFITLTPGASIEYGYVAQALIDDCKTYSVKEIGFDRWRIDVLKAELARLDASSLPLAEFGQGYRDMAPALDALESIIANGKLRHGGHPVLRMCAMNAIAIRDAAGNRKLDKSKQTGRIDGMVALAMAIGSASKAQNQRPEFNIYFL